MTHALRLLLASFRTLVVLTVMLGVLYPAAVLVVGQVAFNKQANGSLIVSDGHTAGSSLIGQSFEGPEWFHPRPSAADYDPMASGASNLAPSSSQLLRQVEKRRAEASAANGVSAESVPPDALTASGSGLDPHISPEYALIQVARVADARTLTASDLEALVVEHTEGRPLGYLGDPRVNVLELNLALVELDG